MKKKNFDRDFEKFYHAKEEYKVIPYSNFLKLPIEFSFGVYQKFFSDNFINLNIVPLENEYFRITILRINGELLRNGIIEHSFNKAQEQAVLAAKNYYSQLMDISDEFCCMFSE